MRAANTARLNLRKNMTNTTDATTAGHPKKRQQLKKDSRDPDYENLNPAIVNIARTNGFVRQPLELYLAGKLTWHEALELMVTSVYGQFKEQQTLLTDVLAEKPAHALLVSAHSGALIKALPRSPFQHEKENSKRLPSGE